MDIPVSQKLDALQQLQEIDSRLDALHKLRGDLPEEVSDLEDEIAGLETRVGKFEQDIKDAEDGIEGYRNGIKEAEALMEKYKGQQLEVRNNREYDAITKEIELQELEKQVCEKRIKEGYARIDGIKERISETNEKLSGRKEDLKHKKKELTELVEESKEEEDKLLAEREKAGKKIEERLFNSYNKIRDNSRNGLAVVKVARGACGGCFNIVPPQRQADIRERKKIIVCEHCGRIFSDAEAVEIPEEPKKKTTRKK